MIRTIILTSEFPPQPGGIGNHALHLAKGLQANGFEVTLVCDSRSKSGVEERLFDRDLCFEVIRIPRRRILFFSYMNRITKAFSLVRNNEIVISSGKFSLWLGAMLGVFYNRKFVAIVHGSEIEL